MAKTGLYEGIQYIDDKQVFKYLFTRRRILSHAQTVEVHAFNKDHAVDRLCRFNPGTTRADWEFIQQLDPDHFVGRLGETLRLDPFDLHDNKLAHASRLINQK